MPFLAELACTAPLSEVQNCKMLNSVNWSRSALSVYSTRPESCTLSALVPSNASLVWKEVDKFTSVCPAGSEIMSVLLHLTDLVPASFISFFVFSLSVFLSVCK